MAKRENNLTTLVHDAFERIEPQEGAKERIYAALIAEQEKRSSIVAAAEHTPKRPQKVLQFSRILPLAASLVILGLVGTVAVRQLRETQSLDASVLEIANEAALGEEPVSEDAGITSDSAVVREEEAFDSVADASAQRSITLEDGRMLYLEDPVEVNSTKGFEVFVVASVPNQAAVNSSALAYYDATNDVWYVELEKDVFLLAHE